ncbi:hypothetical protein KW850_26495 [Bacillus sp. sid0103]|nr:hypothetical protein [Bacillus sp. sid0103]
MRLQNISKNVLTSCVITRDYKTGLPVGTFTCSCGFVFSRKGPDKTNEDRYKIGRIKELGDQLPFLYQRHVVSSCI